MNLTFRSTAAHETERVIRGFFDPGRAGWNVASHRLRYGDAFVMGRTYREAVRACKEAFGERWVLFKHERWIGELLDGAWVPADDLGVNERWGMNL